MTNSRFSQLRNLVMSDDMSRDKISRSTKKLNEDFMSNIPFDTIKDLILRYIAPDR